MRIAAGRHVERDGGAADPRRGASVLPLQRPKNAICERLV
jgi:hypothetical protein